MDLGGVLRTGVHATPEIIKWAIFQNWQMRLLSWGGTLEGYAGWVRNLLAPLNLSLLYHHSTSRHLAVGQVRGCQKSQSGSVLVLGGYHIIVPRFAMT
jgi:hypothetical protein